MIAAVGTASSAPARPSSELPMISATITVMALRPTCWLITFGTRKLFSSKLYAPAEQRHRQSQARRHREGHGNGRNGRE